PLISNMNWLDIIIIVCLAGGLIKSLFDGFIKQVISFLALVAGIFFAGRLAFPLKEFLSEFFTENILSSQLLLILSYIGAFLLIIIAINIIGHLISIVIKSTPAKPLNMLLGGLFGFALWILSLSILMNVITFFDKDYMVISKQTQDNSVFYSKVRAVIPTFYPFIKDYFNPRDKENPEPDDELIVRDSQLSTFNFELNNYVRRF
ncbi:MAG: CvpA family protein, partial [Bacteroidales bacterium]|nr:CvpA family protein [Bacteroidales bacterium]